jgi:beta-N-acetylhexosaminidase
VNSKKIEQIAGRVILSGFEGKSLPYELQCACDAGAVGGLVLFKRNVENPGQVASVLSEAVERSPAGMAPVTAVDQEGGRVVRIGSPLTVLPPAGLFGQIDNPALTYDAGKLVGMELSALGFTLNFAPVMDVNTNEDSPVIGDRAYGSSVDIVVRHALSFARGLKDGGVFPCAKHFPGHGDADVDSHKGLPVVKHSRIRLEKIEMEPFAAWSRTGLGPVMTAHILFPSLDEENPATASRRILNGILKKQFHFSGVILTDDLEMGAIAGNGGAAAMAVSIIRAGADGLLVCRDLKQRAAVIKALVKEAESHIDFMAKLERASGRLLRLASPLNKKKGLSWIGSDAHKKMVDKVETQLAKAGN